MTEVVSTKRTGMKVIMAYDHSIVNMFNELARTPCALGAGLNCFLIDVIARLDRAIQRNGLDFPVKPENDSIEFDFYVLRSWRRVLKMCRTKTYKKISFLLIANFYILCYKKIWKKMISMGYNKHLQSSDM
jgi:hypothetical protein